MKGLYIYTFHGVPGPVNAVLNFHYVGIALGNAFWPMQTIASSLADCHVCHVSIVSVLFVGHVEKYTGKSTAH